MVIADWIMADGRSDEIAGDQPGSLVDQLIECMLTVSAGFTPDDGAGLVVHPVSIPVHIFTIAFHIALLEIGREPVQVLIIGKNGLTFSTIEVVVPYADHGHQVRDILMKS